MEKQIKRDRTYGVEIEFHGVSVRAIEQLRAEGLQVYREHYNHTTRNYWKVVPDASVSGGYRGEEGLELVSPPLSGEEGLADLEKACRALQNAGARISKQCGLHVHHDANDFTTKTFLKLSRLFVKYEPAFDSIMPASRKRNGYCASVADRISTDQINLQPSIIKAIKLIHGNILDRYMKLNLTSYLNHGTVEFRQHSGTTDFEKIKNWILLTQGLVTVAVEYISIHARGVRTLDKLLRISDVDQSVKSFYRKRAKALSA